MLNTASILLNVSHVFTDCNATLVLANSSVVVVYIDLINLASVFVMQFTAIITSTVRTAQPLITTASKLSSSGRGLSGPAAQREQRRRIHVHHFQYCSADNHVSIEPDLAP